MTLTGYPAEVLPWASFFHLFSFSFSPKAHPKGGSAGKPSRAHEKAKKGHQFPNFGLFAPEKVGIGTLQAVQYPTRRCPTLRSPEAPPRGAALARGGRAGSILGHLCLRRLSSRESDRDERLGSAAAAAAGPGLGAVCVRAGGSVCAAWGGAEVAAVASPAPSYLRRECLPTPPPRPPVSPPPPRSLPTGRPSPAAPLFTSLHLTSRGYPALRYPGEGRRETGEKGGGCVCGGEGEKAVTGPPAPRCQRRPPPEVR